MNTVKSERTTASSSCDGTASGEAPKVIILNIDDIQRLYDTPLESVMSFVDFDEVIKKALMHRPSSQHSDSQHWLMTMRSVLSAHTGDDLEEAIHALETIIGMLVDKLSMHKLYRYGRLNYCHRVRGDQLHLIDAKLYYELISREFKDALV